MMKCERQISTMDFTKLLYEVRDHKPNVCIRFRRIGHMWASNFMQIVDIQESGAVFYDPVIGEFVYVHRMADIMQFEIDIRYMEYQPHFHYELIPINS